MSKIILIWLISLLGHPDYQTRENVHQFLLKNIKIVDIVILTDYGVYHEDPEIRFRSRLIYPYKLRNFNKLAQSLHLIKALTIMDSQYDIDIKDINAIKESTSLKLCILSIVYIRLWYSESDVENIFSKDERRIRGMVTNNKELFRQKIKK